jgi:hypothetical protein
VRGPEGPRESACDYRQVVATRALAMFVAQPSITQVVLERLVLHPATHVAERISTVVVGEPSPLRRLAALTPPLGLSLTVERQLVGSREPHPDTLGVTLLRHYDLLVVDEYGRTTDPSQNKVQ